MYSRSILFPFEQVNCYLPQTLNIKSRASSFQQNSEPRAKYNLARIFLRRSKRILLRGVARLSWQQLRSEYWFNRETESDSKSLTEDSLFTVMGNARASRSESECTVHSNLPTGCTEPGSVVVGFYRRKPAPVAISPIWNGFVIAR